MKKNKVLATLIICLIFITCITGCKPEEKEEPAAKMKEFIVANSQGSITYPLAYMLDNNLMEDFAEKFSTIHWNDGDQLKAMITSEQVNLACTPITSAILLYNKGLNIKLANVATWGMLYVLGSPDTGVTSVKDLKGKTIAVNDEGGLHDVIFRHILIKNNIDPDKDIDIVYMDLAEAATRLGMGEIELAVSNEPKTSATIAAAKANNNELKRLLSLEEEWRNVTPNKDGKIPQAGFVVVGDNAENKALVDGFLAKYTESSNWINNHPEESGTVVEKYFDFMKANGVTASIPYAKLNPMPVSECQRDIEAFFNELTTTASLKIIGGKLPDENFYYVSQ